MFKELRKLDKDSNKKIERLGIKATNHPDFDYVIDIFLDIAEKINEIIERLNNE